MIMMIMKNINTVVLSPLRPASLMHKNPPKCTNLYGIRLGRKDQLIDLKMFFVGYPVRVISVAILLAIVERCIIL